MRKLLCFLIFLISLGSSAQELDANQIVGFEVLLAGNCENNFQCAFGHSFLRIIQKNGSSSTDPVLAFTTNNYEPKSLAHQIGFTTVGLFALPLKSDFTDIGSVVNQYMNIEKREIKRIPLQVTPKNKEALIKNINEIISLRQQKKDDKGYDILFNNCAGKIVDLLNQSGLPREIFGIAIPSHLPDHLFRTYNAHYPVMTIPYSPSISRKEMENQFEALPESYYRFCEELECAEQVVRTFNKYFPNGKIEFPNYQRPDPPYEQTTLRTRSEPAHWNGNKLNVERHYQLLQEAETKAGTPGAK
ncbi:MAG: DUF4105 domain-containing protein [Pseudobdellovibrionaceae bacterium]